MIALSTLLFDTDGYLVLSALDGTDVQSMSRRVNRVATLDGGAAVNDFGMSQSDRKFTILARVSAETEAKLRRMIELHGRLMCSTPEGVFLVAFESMSRRSSGTVALNLLVLRKET